MVCSFLWWIWTSHLLRLDSAESEMLNIIGSTSFVSFTSQAGQWSLCFLSSIFQHCSLHSLSVLRHSPEIAGYTCSSSNPFLVKLRKSRLTAHSLVPLFSCMWNRIYRMVQYHSSHAWGLQVGTVHQDDKSFPVSTHTFISHINSP